MDGEVAGSGEEECGSREGQSSPAVGTKWRRLGDEGGRGTEKVE